MNKEPSLKKYLPVFNEIVEYSPKYRFTIFVPVYNAEKTIRKVFESIEKQTFIDFEVIVINDGSKDNSHGVITEILDRFKFPITYHNNEKNLNKMGILFQAIEESKGEFFVIHDADDECFPNALEIFNEQYNSIPENLKPKIGGVTCRCQNQFDNLVGWDFPENPLYSNTFEIAVKYRLSFEKWGFVKTRLLKSIKVDSFIFGKGLIPESFIWMTLAKEGFITKYCHDILRIYHVDVQDSLSTKSYSQKALGMALYAILFCNFFYEDFIWKYPKDFLKRVYSLLKSSIYLDYSLAVYLRSLDSKMIKFLLILAWPFRKIIK